MKICQHRAEIFNKTCSFEVNIPREFRFWKFHFFYPMEIYVILLGFLKSKTFRYFVFWNRFLSWWPHVKPPRILFLGVSSLSVSYRRIYNFQRLTKKPQGFCFGGMFHFQVLQNHRGSFLQKTLGGFGSRISQHIPWRVFILGSFTCILYDI